MENQATPVNTVIPLTSQPPPSLPPPPPPTNRPTVPRHRPNSLQQDHNYLFAQSNPIRRPNQDPSAVLIPFAPRGRGFVADQNGYPHRPGLAYNQQLFGPSQMESMMQFMKGSNPQLHQLPIRSGYPIGWGPRRGSPQFPQPRVAPPQTAILDTSKKRMARSKDEDLVLVRGRKVRITEGASLYSLCRSWSKNGAHVGIQPQSSGTMEPLPKPAPLDYPAEESIVEDEEEEEDVKGLSEKDLLKRHIERAKRVRARIREERAREINRYKERLNLLLPKGKEE